jgi:uncharacterized membrane protein YGL010W
MKLSTYAVTVPAVAIAAVLALANRQIVQFSLDPSSTVAPAIAVAMPLYLLLFLAVLFGVLLGGLVVAIGRRPRRSATARTSTTGSLSRTLSLKRRGPKSPS